MNPQDYDHPDLTAYALGELEPADVARMQQWLAQSPEASTELERIQQTIGVLQAAPALPKRALHPRQRETVLTMGEVPSSRPKNVVPFLGFRRPAGRMHAHRTRADIVWGVAKFAAAACLVAGAYMVGQKTASRVTPIVAHQDESKAEIGSTEKQATTNTPPAPVAPEIARATIPEQKLVTTAPVVTVPKSHAPLPPAPVAQAPAVIAEAKAATVPAPTTVASSHASTVAATKAAPSQAAAPVTTTTPVSLKGFYAAATSPEAALPLHPQLIRPLPVPHEFAGVVLASPLPLDAKPAPLPRKPESQPALKIHTWKSEIASCPWDANRRLMRFVAQVPVEQPGIESFDQDYQLTVKFDPFHVQGFRLVTEKHMRPTGTGTQATRFAWYEIIPTRNFNATAEKPVTIGTVSIEQPRGATSDPSPLKVVDKGLDWSDAREDFVFETAMIGWNMLLSGKENISALNSKLVLDIAEKTRGEDAKGERTKFINVVKQAQKAVGM